MYHRTMITYKSPWKYKWRFFLTLPKRHPSKSSILFCFLFFLLFLASASFFVLHLSFFFRFCFSFPHLSLPFVLCWFHRLEESFTFSYKIWMFQSLFLFFFNKFFRLRNVNHVLTRYYYLLFRKRQFFSICNLLYWHCLILLWHLCHRSPLK